MILVDTSVWASYFNGETLPEVAYLDAVLAREQEDIGVIPIVITEVLQGFRSESSFDRTCRLLRRLPLLEPSLDSYIRAARLYRHLRSNGVTVRGAVDCLIAQVCIETGCRLLTLDRDFRLIARHTSLRLARP